MKRTLSAFVGAAIAGLLVGGCVPVHYHKTITVEKDASGKVLKVIETESVTEPHSEPTRFESIKGGKFEHLK